MHKDEIVKNICAALKEDDIIAGYAYDHFEKGEAVDPPYVVYRRVAPENLNADGVVYYRGSNVDVEIYASDPDEMADLMDVMEGALTDAGIVFRIAADTVYIDSEEFYETLYEI